MTLGGRFVGPYVQLFYGAIILSFMSGVLWGFAHKVEGCDRLYLSSDPRALGVFHDRRRTCDGSDEPDFRVSGSAFAGLVFLAHLASRPLVDALARLANDDCHSHPSLGGHLMPDAKTIAFYDSAAERYANLTDTGAPNENLRRLWRFCLRVALCLIWAAALPAPLCKCVMRGFDLILWMRPRHD